MARMTKLPRRARSVLLSLVAQRLGETTETTFTRARAWFHAWQTVWHARRDIVRFLRTGDAGLAYDLRRRFGLGGTLGAAQPVPDDLFQASDGPQRSPPATIVIPIYNAADMVERLLGALPDTLSPNQAIILVNDGSSDPRVAQITSRFERDWPTTETINLTENQGFVAAVTAAISRVHSDHHVILLNSDTIPPRDWIPRLLAPILASDNIASVTPLSNAAEILSVPCAGLDTAPTANLIDAMDRAAQRLRPRAVDLPTGIGFCMALNRRYLDRIGGFDPAFGQGYGEEVDWCQRASAVGGRHVVVTNLVVGHLGGASFGAETRRRKVAHASRIITDRYPAYSGAVAEWERRDPIAPERLAIAMAWAAEHATGRIPIYVAHAIGGGAETALQTEIAAARKTGAETVVILRVGGRANWRVELCGTRFTLAGDVDDVEVVHALLSPLAHRHVIYSCAVHAAEPAAIPNELLRLADGHRLSVRLHDFFPISPSWNLLGSDGRFHGVPRLETHDPAHGIAPTSTTPGCSHAEWRSRWGRVMDLADDITVFAPSGAALLSAAYPGVEPKITVRPHQILQRPPRLPSGGQTLGVLGGINHPKGGAVLQALSRDGARRIAIIGELDGCFHLPPPHVVNGRYKQAEIARLAQTYDIGAWFLPSVCPETFSFATHEALATGLPVACFNLGAQGETVADAPNGHLFDLDPSDIPAIAARIETLFPR